MREPDWARLLKYLHESRGSHTIEYNPAPSPESANKELIDALRNNVNFSSGVGTYESFIDMLEHMDDMGLIHWGASRESAEIELTKKGFNIGHERELRTNQRRTNLGIGVLTAFLVTGSLLQGYGAFFAIDGTLEKWAMLAVLIVSVVVALGMIGYMLEGDASLFVPDWVPYI